VVRQIQSGARALRRGVDQRARRSGAGQPCRASRQIDLRPSQTRHSPRRHPKISIIRVALIADFKTSIIRLEALAHGVGEDGAKQPHVRLTTPTATARVRDAGTEPRCASVFPWIVGLLSPLN